MRLYTRAGQCLYPFESAGAGRPDLLVGEVLHGVLFGSWTDEERRHLDCLQDKLVTLIVALKRKEAKDA